jgi:hypothetical protein
VNKGGDPRVSSRTKIRISRMSVSIYLAGVSCSGKLCRRTPLGVLCPDIAGSDGIQLNAPVFLSDHLVSEGVLQSSAGCYHHTTRFLIPL